jgi:hypothetical protein
MSDQTINSIRIAIRLREAHDAAKGLLGVNYSNKVEPYKKFIKEYMARYEKSELEATIDLCQIEPIFSNEMAQMMLLAAAVDILEADTHQQ